MFRNNLIIGAVSLAMPLLCGLIVNKVGKRNLLVVCLVVSGTFGVGLSFADSSALVLGLSSVSVAINSMGIGHISSIVVELFPTHLRAMAVSLHLMAGRTGSIAGNLIFGLLLSTNCAFAFYAIGGALLTCAVLSCLLPARGKYAA
ncbi:synaptic vesicle glycoprotein 2C-like [Frankliniella occidentalis]|uniref:Synaptic vesicle glycoprotein 2C-like n=1 Tax=Frankliniella occidentalis TaxID=133901 RepID=A0A9C6XBN2_FRAOC|nr:synaptic vesicle glycoprotein 2C-like [Frankliniella occidentalis]